MTSQARSREVSVSLSLSLGDEWLCRTHDKEKHQQKARDPPLFSANMKEAISLSRVQYEEDAEMDTQGGSISSCPNPADPALFLFSSLPSSGLSTRYTFNYSYLVQVYRVEHT